MASGEVGAPVGGDALAAVEEFDGVGGVSGEEWAPDQAMGDGVVVAVELDVVVEVHADLLPLKAIDVSSLEKARRCHRKGVSRVVDSFTSDEPHDSGHWRKVIGLGPESVIGFDRNR